MKHATKLFLGGVIVMVAPGHPVEYKLPHGMNGEMFQSWKETYRKRVNDFIRAIDPSLLTAKKVHRAKKTVEQPVGNYTDTVKKQKVTNIEDLIEKNDTQGGKYEE
jgi:hypothetical protein